MVERKGENWCFKKDVTVQKAGDGVERRVLAFCDELMCVENTFKRGLWERCIIILIPRLRMWPADVFVLLSGRRRKKLEQETRFVNRMIFLMDVYVWKREFW